MFLLAVTYTVFAQTNGMFMSLCYDEELAYIHKNENKTLILYAVNRNNREAKREIGRWNDVESGMLIQFSNNYKMCFFIIKKAHFYALHQVNGYTGQVVYLMDMPTGIFRVSENGKYICYIKSFFNSEKTELLKQVPIVLFDITEKTINELKWGPDVPPDGGWYLIRSADNTFKIYALWEGGSIYAVSIINPETGILKTEWDESNTNSLTLPHFQDMNWQDAVIKDITDPKINLLAEPIQKRSTR
jgi:hypothetical protein